MAARNSQEQADPGSLQSEMLHDWTGLVTGEAVRVEHPQYGSLTGPVESSGADRVQVHGAYHHSSDGWRLFRFTDTQHTLS